MASLRPVPPKRRVVEASAWVKRWNSLACCSGFMPMPVSLTRKLSQSAPSRAARETERVMRPPSVNLAALLRRLMRHWRSLVWSVCASPRPSAISRVRWLPFLSTSDSTVAATSRTTSGTEKVSA